MQNARARLVTAAFVATDLVMTAAAFCLAHALRDAVTGLAGDWPGPILPLVEYVPLLVLILPLWLILFQAMGLYGEKASRSLRPEFGRLVTALTVGGLLLAVAIVALKLYAISRPAILLFLLIDGLLVVVGRGVVRLAATDRAARHVIVGGERVGVLRTAASFSAHGDWGIRLVGIASDGTWMSDGELPYRFLGALDDIPLLARQEPVDEVIVVPSSGAPDQVEAFSPLFARLERQGIVTRLLVNFLPGPLTDLSLERLGDMPLLTFNPAPRTETALILRRSADVVLAAVLLIVLSPVFVVIAAVIALTSPGPVLYRQTRCGLNGRPFTFLKFRSMRPASDLLKPALRAYNEMDGPAFKMSDDPRVTRFGRFLRRTSLDELPQLWNILAGDMSFVGPRPAVVEEVAQYEPWQRRRLSMKPGLTCLWQISGRSELTFEEWMRLDLEYIDNWSLWLDVKIALKTIPAVLFGRGAK